MIVGYYERVFFGGGTYYKLSKKDNEEKWKIEYAHTDIPNKIPNAENYIKKYDTLEINNEEEIFEGKIKHNYIEYSEEIQDIIEYVNNCNWDVITKEDYNKKEAFMGISWDFYIEFKEKKYEISGFEKFPNEVINIIKSVDNISRKYLDDIKLNKVDLEMINKYKKRNLNYMKFLYKKRLIDKDKYKEAKLKYKKKKSDN